VPCACALKKKKKKEGIEKAHDSQYALSRQVTLLGCVDQRNKKKK
jgi:hypothetical protein